jgi:glucokinase
MAWAVGVDFGGTSIKVGLVRRDGRVAAARSLPTRRFGRPAAFLEGVGGAAADVVREARLPWRQVAGVGVGAPGPIDVARGVVASCVNVPGWRNVPLQRALARRLGRPCRVDNDANAAALGEWRLGAGRGARSMVGLTLGTGIGGGLIIEGRLVHGASGSAGEIGHMLMDPRGPRCGCGRHGCLEALAGTAAILRLGRTAMRRSPRLQRFVRAAGRLEPRVLGDAGRAGDPAARAVWREIGRRLGEGLANVTNVLNPERIVIGGGVANNWSLFGPSLQATLARAALPAPAARVRVVRGRLGDEAGVIGSAMLVWER